ncbi:MAG: ATP-dependent zinc metalloprotease FtsH [Planctomycetes bacterium]|nr:ATP-dependent zinc metalloprotease FtsH [Planctomycetota bacterium]
MPSPRDQPRPERRSRRQDAMPSAWLWVVVLLLLCGVLYITFLPSTGSLDYGDFVRLVEAKKVLRVTFGEGASSLVAEFDPEVVKNLDEKTKAQIRNNKAEVVLWEGDVKSGEVSKLLAAKEIPRKTERTFSSWVGPISFVLTTLIILAIFVFFFILPRFRDPFGGNFLNNYIRSPAKRYDKTKSRTTYDDVADMTNAKRELQEIVDFLKYPEKFQKLGAQIPKGVLLVGPPGTGKTLLARAVAGEAGVPFFSINGSEFIQMFVGVGASRVRDMFKTAKDAAPCILFIDEIDAVGRMRGAGVGGGSDEREQTLNQILSEMDGFLPNESVIVLAATNRPDVLDSALLRPGRFDRHVTIDRPTWQGRLEILKVHTRNKPLDDDVNLEAIARKMIGMTGADLRNLANEAALIASRDNKARLDRSDFENAADRVLMGPKRDEVLTEEVKRRTAYHEAGHAVVGWYMPQADPPQKVSIIPRGQAGGATWFNVDEERVHKGLDFFKAQLAVSMGGRAAERLMYNQPYAGVEMDLKQATRLARYMVTHWGMSDKLGPMSFRIGEEHVFLGKEIQEPRDFSEETAHLIDEEVRKFLQEADESAFRIIEDHRSQMDLMVELLLQKEELLTDDIEAILGKKGPIETIETSIMAANHHASS